MMKHSLDSDNEVFFYEQEFYVLSNFSSFRVLWEEPYGIFDFDTNEHLYHWLRFPRYSPHRDIIQKARSAHEAFTYAQKHKKDQVEWWDKPHKQETDRPYKVVRMKQALYAKAAQHEYVYRKLKQTGKRTLWENSWRDDFWGWGPNRDGKNWLGRLWMEIRDGILQDELNQP